LTYKTEILIDQAYRKRTHPDLVPYADLLEPEKEYDRKTSMEALKAIVCMGYGIENKG
jgi:hypothetical protein